MELNNLDLTQGSMQQVAIMEEEHILLMTLRRVTITLEVGLNAICLS